MVNPVLGRAEMRFDTWLSQPTPSVHFKQRTVMMDGVEKGEKCVPHWLHFFFLLHFHLFIACSLVRTSKWESGVTDFRTIPLPFSFLFPFHPLLCLLFSLHACCPVHF